MQFTQRIGLIFVSLLRRAPFSIADGDVQLKAKGLEEPEVTHWSLAR
jgi:hypothetical protein